MRPVGLPGSLQGRLGSEEEAADWLPNQEGVTPPSLGGSSLPGKGSLFVLKNRKQWMGTCLKWDIVTSLLEAMTVPSAGLL